MLPREEARHDEIDSGGDGMWAEEKAYKADALKN